MFYIYTKSPMNNSVNQLSCQVHELHSAAIDQIAKKLVTRQSKGNTDTDCKKLTHCDTTFLVTG